PRFPVLAAGTSTSNKPCGSSGSSKRYSAGDGISTGELPTTRPSVKQSHTNPSPSPPMKLTSAFYACGGSIVCNCCCRSTTQFYSNTPRRKKIQLYLGQ